MRYDHKPTINELQKVYNNAGFVKHKCRKLKRRLKRNYRQLNINGSKEEWKTINGTPVLFVDGVAQGEIGGKVQKFEGKFKGTSAKDHLRKRQRRDKDYLNLTPQEYEQKALELLQSEVGDNIQGYRTDDGKIVRWDTNTNDYATGHLDGTINTMFKPKSQTYFERHMKEDEEKEGMLVMNNSRYTLCPVCGKKDAFTGEYDICVICEWEHDFLQLDNPNDDGGANHLSLNDYKAEWQAKNKQ